MEKVCAMPEPERESERQPQPDPFGAMRQVSHERIMRLWQSARLGMQFEGEDALMVQAMRDHPEYYEVWEQANDYTGTQAEVEGVSPVMHVLMHVVVENQAEQNNPPEVRKALEYKTDRGMSRHDAVHDVASVFAHFLWQMLHDKKPFNNEAYRRELRRMLPRSGRSGSRRAR